jgi:hypothetical protein
VFGFERVRGNEGAKEQKSQQEACAAACDPRATGPIAALPSYLHTPARVKSSSDIVSSFHSKYFCYSAESESPLRHSLSQSVLIQRAERIDW